MDWSEFRRDDEDVEDRTAEANVKSTNPKFWKPRWIDTHRTPPSSVSPDDSQAVALGSRAIGQAPISDMGMPQPFAKPVQFMDADSKPRTFEITSPDGKTYVVTGPPGSTKEQALERVKAQHASASAPKTAATTPPSKDASAPVSAFDNTSSTAGDVVKEGGKGLLRGVANAAGDIGEAVMGPFGPSHHMGNLVADLTGGTPPPNDPSYGQRISHAAGIDPAGKTMPGRFSGTVGEFVGNPESYIGPGGVMSKAATAALSGAGSEAAGELTDEAPGSRLVGALAGGQLPRTAARAAGGMRAPPEREAARDFLRGEGVELTAGETSGNRAMRTAESQLGNAPGSGQAFTREKERELRQYTRAVVRRMGEDADNASPETINNARDRAGRQLESAATGMRIRMDPQMGNEFVDLRADLQREGATPDQINRINQMLENVQNGFTTTIRRLNTGQNDTIMDGRTYQALTRHGTPLQRAIDAEDPTVSYYALRVRSALDDAMERTAMGRGTRPGTGMRQALDDLREARRNWYNMMVISRAVTGPGEAGSAGLVTPQRLRAALTGSQDKKLQYAAGRGDLHDLARAGELMMAPIGSSQTSERSLITAIPAAMGAAAGQAIHGEPVSGALAGVVTPGLAGRGLMSEPVQNFLKGDVMGQGAARDFFDSQASARTTALRSGAAAGTDKDDDFLKELEEHVRSTLKDPQAPKADKVAAVKAGLQLAAIKHKLGKAARKEDLTK